MTNPSLSVHELDLAQKSYDRCQQAPQFFRAFYERFLASDPAIPPYFKDTRFDRQDRLLQHGLGLLLSYARRPNPHLLERIGRRHSPGDLDIPANLYPHFVESLVETVKQYDPSYEDAVGVAWRAALAPGIAYMQQFRE